MTAFTIRTGPEFGKRKLQPGRYVWRRGAWQRYGEPAAKSGKGPMVVKDCEPFISMADGKTIINSRSQYRAHLKARGLVEVGNQPMREPERPKPNVAPVLKDVYHAARDGNTDALR